MPDDTFIDPPLPWATDTHCHLDHPKLIGDLDAVLQRSHLAGVRYIIIPGSGAASSLAASRIAEQTEGIWAAAGIHPHEARNAPQEMPLIRSALSADRHVAVGEAGLDFHYSFSTPEEQVWAFQAQIELAKEKPLPLILHVREAWQQARAILEKQYDGTFPLVFHAFSGTADDADWVLRHDGFIGIGGVITFKKADGLRDIVRALPPDRVLLETDAPYLTPAPHRGKRNEPAYTSLVAAELARLWGMNEAGVRALTTLSARQIFGLPRWGEGDAVYRLYGNIYLNITNRCSNDCAFCVRKRTMGVGDARLWLDVEPTIDEVLSEVAAQIEIDKPQEIVFCGFGEPTMRWDDAYELAKRMRGLGIPLRLDTNGQGNLLNQRDITPQVAEVFDAVSVSLNAANDEEYRRVCKPRLGGAFTAVQEFIVGCASRGMDVVATAVAKSRPDSGFEDVESLAKDMGVEWRLR